MTRSGIADLARMGLAALILHVVLIQPNHPDAMTLAALFVFSLELPVVLLGLAALPAARWSAVARGVLMAVLMTIAVLKAVDLAMFTALGRGFNPVADLPLIPAGLRLATGSIGPALALVAVLAALLTVVFVAWAVWWATSVWARVAAPRFLSRGLAAASVLFAGVVTAQVGEAMGRWNLPVSPPGSAFTARVAAERVGMAHETLTDLRDFKAAAAEDSYADRVDLLARIDRDVLVVFVESYGRASLDTPLYAETHRATLTQGQARLEALGLSMRSGFLRAPTRGGQSWLSHATFANGLWIANQTSYGAALVSARQSLFHLASDAGFHTAAVMPQITLDWPEATLMGFETILAAEDLGYAGPSFNWVTMPDQFTFAALDRLLRDRDGDRPIFAQLALGSSHAPWVPVPELVAWDAIDDGTIFAPMAQSGDPPDVVWRDHDRVRDQYRRAVDYALRVVLGYAARHADTPPLIFVVGDHQAAGFVAQDDRPDVPVHLIGPGALVSAAESWDWTDGLIPGENADVRSMADMRDMILEAYSGPVTAESDT